MGSPSRREHLIQTALELFVARGFHATGIDTILSAAGVSKKTLYNHFESKEELIVAVLRRYDETFRRDFMRSVEEAADSPRERLLAVFDVARKWFTSEGFSGCPFVKVVGEYPETESPIRDVCQESKSMIRDYLHELAVETDASDPRALADELALLLEGAIVTAQIARNDKSADTAKRLARLVLERALDQPPRRGSKRR